MCLAGRGKEDEADLTGGGRLCGDSEAGGLSPGHLADGDRDWPPTGSRGQGADSAVDMTVASVAPVRVGAVLVLRRAQDAILRQALRQAQSSFENSKLTLRRSPNAVGLTQFLENGGTFDPKSVSKPSQGCPFVNFQMASQDVAQDAILRQALRQAKDAAQDKSGQAAPGPCPLSNCRDLGR